MFQIHYPQPISGPKVLLWSLLPVYNIWINAALSTIFHRATSHITQILPWVWTLLMVTGLPQDKFCTFCRTESSTIFSMLFFIAYAILKSSVTRVWIYVIYLCKLFICWWHSSGGYIFNNNNDGTRVPCHPKALGTWQPDKSLLRLTREKHQTSALQVLCKGIKHVGSSLKGPIIRKVFPWHDVLMDDTS